MEKILWRWKDKGGSFFEGWLIESIHEGDMVKIAVYEYSSGDWYKRNEIEMVKK